MSKLVLVHESFGLWIKCDNCLEHTWKWIIIKMVNILVHFHPNINRTVAFLKSYHLKTEIVLHFFSVIHKNYLFW